MAHDFPDFDLGLPPDELRKARGILSAIAGTAILLVVILAVLA